MSLNFKSFSLIFNPSHVKLHCIHLKRHQTKIWKRTLKCTTVPWCSPPDSGTLYSFLHPLRRRWPETAGGKKIKLISEDMLKVMDRKTANDKKKLLKWFYRMNFKYKHCQRQKFYELKEVDTSNCMQEIKFYSNIQDL